MVNIAVILMLAIITIVYFAGKSSIAISKVISEIELNSFAGLKNSLEFLMRQMFETANMIPVIKWILDAFVSNEITVQFFIVYISMLVIGFLLYSIIIENISVHYFKNGLLGNKKQM